MRVHQITRTIIFLCLALTLIGCDGNIQPRVQGDPPQEVFDSAQLAAGPSTITIDANLPVKIEVVAYPIDEVGLDYIATGWGDTEADAAAEAHQNIAVTMTSSNSGIQISARSVQANPKDSVILHVRVPRTSSVVVMAVKGGDIDLLGEMNNVTASTLNGNINLRGATGSAQLTTNHGNLVADSRSLDGKATQIKLSAEAGNITLFSVGSAVTASTTEGNIRFIGSLSGTDNQFSTTGAGNVLLALPANISYSFVATGGSQVVADLMPATLVCGMVSNSESVMHAKLSPDILGYVDIAGTVTGTNYISGTMKLDQNNYFRFNTNRSELTRYSPTSAEQPNGPNTANVFSSSKCDALNGQERGQVQFVVRADKGIIALHLNRKH